MKHDTFSHYHPLTNFIFFVFAIGCGVVLQHPVYLAAGFLCAGIYYLLLSGKKAWKTAAFLLPTCCVIAVINPLFNTQGRQVLFSLFGRPYTLEALYFGGAVAAIFAIMMLWFGCYNAVMTGDKFCALFGTVIPSLSLLLVMVLRMIPNLLRKARQVSVSRSSIGKGVSSEDGLRQKLSGGMQVLSALIGWSLEGSMTTADSMRSRGYGSARRSSFRLYRFRLRDWIILAVFGILAALTLTGAATGSAEAVYTPLCRFAPMTGFHLFSFIAYCLFLAVPIILHVKEALVWHISISRI